MINFRFHLVSLTAVFLALAAGITIGAGVVDRATVDFLERRVSEVAASRDATNARNDELQAELGQWNRFADELGTRAVDGALPTAKVLLMTTSGGDRKAVDELRAAIQAAGATVEGTVTLTGKWGLEEEQDVRDLADIVGLTPSTRPDELRRAALAQMADAWGAGSSVPLIDALVASGFLTVEGVAADAPALGSVALSGTLFTVASSHDADVAPRVLAAPLVRQLVERGLPVLAVQPRTPPPPEDGAELPPSLAELVRADEDLSGRVSSVDAIDDYRGRVAAVHALAELARGGAGAYGFDPDADRLLPEQPG